MGRKGKSSPAEDFIVVASKLPYWAALVLAVISYFLLHAYVIRRHYHNHAFQSWGQKSWFLYS